MNGFFVDSDEPRNKGLDLSVVEASSWLPNIYDDYASMITLFSSLPFHLHLR